MTKEYIVTDTVRHIFKNHGGNENNPELEHKLRELFGMLPEELDPTNNMAKMLYRNSMFKEEK